MTPNAFRRVMVAAGLSLYPIAGAAAQSRPVNTPPLNPPSASERRGTMSELPDSTLVKRWSELFANLITEFKNDGRDPKGIVRGDFSTREISILTDSESEDAWVGIEVSDRALTKGDLRTVAAELYRAWKAAAGTI